MDVPDVSVDGLDADTTVNRIMGYWVKGGIAESGIGSEIDVWSGLE